MSSGFVAGGTIDEPIKRDEEWLQAQQEVEENRRRKEQEGQQNGGKSLFEILQGNKAAKQEAFEESIRLKNQFRNFDEDEVEFLDSVLESTRKQEQDIKKETAQQLELFRRQREEADKALLESSEVPPEVAGSPLEGAQKQEDRWAVNASKRKRDTEKEREQVKGFKIRRTSSNMQEKSGQSQGSASALNSNTQGNGGESALKAGSPKASPKTTSKDGPPNDKRQSSPVASSALLVGYSSDEDD